MAAAVAGSDLRKRRDETRKEWVGRVPEGRSHLPEEDIGGVRNERGERRRQEGVSAAVYRGRCLQCLQRRVRLRARGVAGRTWDACWSRARRRRANLREREKGKGWVRVTVQTFRWNQRKEKGASCGSAWIQVRVGPGCTRLDREYSRGGVGFGCGQAGLHSPARTSCPCSRSLRDVYGSESSSSG